MNFIDRAIAAIAPETGARRARARAKQAAVMNYDAASKGRRTYGWKAPGSDADAASQAGRGQLRNLSRDMIRNRWTAARAQSVVTGNVVGSGIAWSVNADKPVRDAVDRVLRKHLGTVAIDAFGEQTLSGLQQTAMNAVFGDGEVLVRRRMRNSRFEAHLALPFQVQLMEVDHLDVTITRNGNNEVIDGIEYGPTGRIEAFHLYDLHPGSVVNLARGRLTTRRVPAADIVHVRRLDRPGQLRGVPWLSPVMMTVGELGDYQEAEILKQRMAALLAAVVTSDDSGEKFKGKGLEELEPGGIVGLQPGQEVRFTEPPNVTGYDAFMKRGLAAIAAGIGITYEALTGDLSGTNFTSFRAGRMEMDRQVESWQRQIMVEQFCRGIERWIGESWPLARSGPMAQDIKRADQARFEIEWTPPRRALVDPSKEIPATLKAISGGLTSRQRAQRQMGIDPDQVRSERVDDAEKDRAAGLAAPPPNAENENGADAPNTPNTEENDT